MKKQRTTNSFQGGLVQDYNPLSAEQTTLYDCLNGTFITNDGDELLLQNDMGNARVFQIRLDNGYVPVGMCEYGGVTYIASYNPITNKGQVGSFPSPQETFFSKTWGNDEAFKSNCCTLGTTGRNPIVQEFAQQIFNSDEIIRPGDRFDIFVKDEKDENTEEYKTYLNRKLISHTDNITDGKVSSPKNKAITISICVADSSGNLHDITPTLKRFDIETGMELTEINKYEDSSLIKQNTGTIFQKYPEIEDSIVDKYDIDPKNIYNHKISGNLFIVYRLNSLDSIEINAEFFKGPINGLSKYLTLSSDEVKLEGDDDNVKDNMLTVAFDVIYRYNCPDGYYDNDDNDEKLQQSDSTGIYHSLYGKREDFSPANVINGVDVNVYKNDETTSKSHKLLFDINNGGSKDIDEISVPVYDYDTNLYTSRQRYLVSDINVENVSKLKLDLQPAIRYGYLDFFRQQMNINIDKLNSGEVYISQWRYFVDDSGVRIYLGLETYPFLGTRLTDVRVDFYKLTTSHFDFENPISYQLGNKTSYHGNNEIYVSFDSLDQRHIYCAIVSYKLANIINDQLVSDSTFYAGARILITTRLHNKLFSDSSILDFNNLSEDEQEKIFLYHPNIQISEQLIKDSSTLGTTGEFLNPSKIEEDGQEFSSIVKTKEVNIDKRITASLNHNDDYLYPFDIGEDSYSFKDIQLIKDENNNPLSILPDDIIINGDIDYSKAILSDLIKESRLTPSITNQTKGEIHIEGTLKSEFKGNVTKGDIIFSNALMQYLPSFNDNSEWAKNRRYELFGYSEMDEQYYIAYGVNYRGLKSHKDHHAAKYIEVNLIKKQATDSDPENIHTMTDLHQQVYGSSWDYPDVMYAGNHAANFSFTKFVQNQEFIKLIKDKTFILFQSKGTSSNNRYNKDNVNDWISLSRTGVKPDDQRILKIAENRPLLFWKYEDTLYLIATDANGMSYDVNSFCHVMSNIYVRSEEEVQFTDVEMISNEYSAYNLGYTAAIKFSVDVIPNYTPYFTNTKDYGESDFVSTATTNLNTLSREIFDDDRLWGTLAPYITFRFSKGEEEKQTIVLQTTVDIEGMEDVKETIKMMAGKNYNRAILIGSSGQMLTKDQFGDDIISSQAYEIIGNPLNGYKAAKFGSYSDLNKKLANNIEIVGGKIIPKKTLSISTKLLSGGSGDYLTTLSLVGQPSILIINQ